MKSVRKITIIIIYKTLYYKLLRVNTLIMTEESSLDNGALNFFFTFDFLIKLVINKCFYF